MTTDDKIKEIMEEHLPEIDETGVWDSLQPRIQAERRKQRMPKVLGAAAAVVLIVGVAFATVRIAPRGVEIEPASPAPTSTVVPETDEQPDPPPSITESDGLLAAAADVIVNGDAVTATISDSGLLTVGDLAIQLDVPNLWSEVDDYWIDANGGMTEVALGADGTLAALHIRWPMADSEDPPVDHFVVTVADDQLTTVLQLRYPEFVPEPLSFPGEGQVEWTETGAVKCEREGDPETVTLDLVTYGFDGGETMVEIGRRGTSETFVCATRFAG